MNRVIEILEEVRDSVNQVDTVMDNPALEGMADGDRLKASHFAKLTINRAIALIKTDSHNREVAIKQAAGVPTNITEAMLANNQRIESRVRKVRERNIKSYGYQQPTARRQPDGSSSGNTGS